MKNSRSILKTEKLCKSFSNGGRQQHVIKNLDLEIREGDFTIIMGASGSGKSTLLYALSGMDKPSMGKVFFGDKEIQDFSEEMCKKYGMSTVKKAILTNQLSREEQAKWIELGEKKDRLIKAAVECGSV